MDSRFDDTTPESSSRGFRIVKKAEAEVSISTIIATPSITPNATSTPPETLDTTPTSESSSEPSSTATTTTTHNAGGLSAGAKGGIGAGVAVGGILLIGFAVLLWRHYRGRPQHAHPPPQTPGVGAYPPRTPLDMQSPSELSGAVIPELDADKHGSRAELAANGKRV